MWESAFEGTPSVPYFTDEDTENQTQDKDPGQWLSYCLYHNYWGAFNAALGVPCPDSEGLGGT